MKSSKIIVCVILLLGQSLSHAAPLKLKTERGTIHLESIKGWKLSKNVLGMPFVYFSERKNGRRSNISFTHTGHDFKFDQASLKKNEGQFKEEKNKWAKRVGAKLLTVTPYRVFANEYGHKVHHIGMTYSFNKKTYIENSYYIQCKGKTLFSKALYTKKNKNHQNQIDLLIKRVNCD